MCAISESIHIAYTAVDDAVKFYSESKQMSKLEKYLYLFGRLLRLSGKDQGCVSDVCGEKGCWGGGPGPCGKGHHRRRVERAHGVEARHKGAAVLSHEETSRTRPWEESHFGPSRSNRSEEGAMATILAP